MNSAFLDFIDGYDKEVVVEPEEASIAARRYFYWDVHEEAAILAVPDSNGFTSGCRDSIALRLVFRRYRVVPVFELFVGCDVVDGGCAVRRET